MTEKRPIACSRLRQAACALACAATCGSLATWAHAQGTSTAPYTVSTAVGQVGVGGSANGSGTGAQLNSPTGIAFDRSGNLYIADQDNQLIRKITPSWAVTTYAGSGSAAEKAGTGTAAQLDYPTGVAVDSSGNVYVADARGCTIRKIAPGGVVTTLAGGAAVGGSGAGASNDGTGTAAGFYAPHGVAVDTAGNVYVADTGNYTIRKVTPGGVVTTLAGVAGNFGSADGVGTAARFFMPRGIAIDTFGNLYVADTNNCTIRKVTPSGQVTTLAGTAGVIGSADGTGSQAQFAFPNGIAVDGVGSVFVVDQYNQTLRKIAPGGVVTTIAGSPGIVGSLDGAGSSAAFFNPAGVAVDSSGNLYVTDFGNDTLRIATYRPQAGAPVIVTQPAAQTAATGATVVFTVDASGATPTGSAPSYQWYLNTAAISGATSPSLLVTARSANAGKYVCVETNAIGSTSSQPAALAVISTPDPGRLINLSVNTVAGKNQVLTTGFVIGGAGTSGSQNVLIRATGPALAALGVSNTLPDPTLSVLSGSSVVASNDNWGTPAGNQATVTAADAAVFAFPLTDPGSLDAALVAPLQTGGYTAQISGNGKAAGTTLAEVYDDTPSGAYTAAAPRLVNISCTQQVTAGAILTAGFTIGGSTSKTVLIRATGPALAAAPFNLSGTMPDPTLSVYSGQTIIASNTAWAGNPLITSVDSAVYAFALTNPTSLDSAVLITLAPGSYTAQAKSASGTAGMALIEVYDVP